MSVLPQIIKGKLEGRNGCSTVVWLKEAIHNGDAYYKHVLPEVARKKLILCEIFFSS